MYGYPSGFRPPAAAGGGIGGWGSQPLQQQQQPPQQQQQPLPSPPAPVALLNNPSFALQNPNYFLQNPQAALVFLQQHQQQLLQQQQLQQQQQQQQQQFLLQNQNPNTFPIQNPPPSNNPNLHIPPPQNLNNQNQNQQFSNSKQTHPIEKVDRQNISPPQNPKLPNSKQAYSIDKVDRAVAKARRNIIAAGENVTAWQVSQDALLSLKVDSWSSLNFPMQKVPSLHSLMLLEGKINAFIHCFVGVQRITSLYDLEVAICKNEGVDTFDKLELGPLLRHPLVLHYFSLSSDITEVFKITGKEVCSLLWKFMDKKKKSKNHDDTVRIEEFLDFVAKKRSVASKEELCLRIQSLGMHVSVIRKAMSLETATLKKPLDNAKKKLLDNAKKKPLDGAKMKSKRRRPLLWALKKQLDERFSSISQRVESFSSVQKVFCGKHTRFGSSGSDEGENIDDEDFGSEDERTEDANLRSQNVASSSDRVSSCPYPSEIEEMTRLGLKGEGYGHLAPASPRHNESCSGSSKKKRKYENPSSTMSAPSGSSKKKREPEDLGRTVSKVVVELDVDTVDNSKEIEEAHNCNKADLAIANHSIKTFITTWKEACRDHTVPEVFERMLQFYNIKARRRKKIKLMFSSFPFVGLLNVAISSIKSGMWDSIYDTFLAISQQELTNSLMQNQSDYEIIDVEPSVKDAPVITEHSDELTHSVSVEDIIRKAAMYFELDNGIHSRGKSVLEKRINILIELYNCEFWLAEQFLRQDI